MICIGRQAGFNVHKQEKQTDMSRETTNITESLSRHHFRIIAILASVLLLIFLHIPQNTYADDYIDNNGMTFQYTVSGTEDDMYAVITGCDRNTVPEDGIVVVPDSIDGYPIREIGTKALYALNGMREAVIPGSVQKIGQKAFYVSENLEDVVLPEGIESIGANAFQETGLRTINFPDSLKSIGSEAFSNCGKLSEVSFSKGVSSVGSNAFANCLSLKAFSVDPDNQNFAAIDDVLFSKGGETLIKYPVMRTTDGVRPNEYIVPEGTKTIGDGAFQYAGALKSVKLADSVETIGRGAFEYCDGLQAFTLSSAIKTIGDGAFTGCAYITSINLPKGLSYLPSDAFAGCQRIAEYNVEEGNAFYSSDEGVLFTADGTVLMKYPSLKADTEYIAPSGVHTISDYAFQILLQFFAETVQIMDRNNVVAKQQQQVHPHG